MVSPILSGGRLGLVFRLGDAVGVGDSATVGADVGAAQASKLTANSNDRGISIRGTIGFKCISIPSLALILIMAFSS